MVITREVKQNQWENSASPTGIEPAISSVTGKHVNHYTTGPRRRNYTLSYIAVQFRKKQLFLPVEQENRG